MIWHPVRRLGERCLASVTRACAIASVVGIVNTGAVVIHGKYRSSEVNKSIVISIIDRNVYRWVMEKRCFSQKEVKFDFQVKFDLEVQRSITPQNYSHLNQGVLHLCFKFGDSSLNGWWVIVRTSKWLIHTHWQIHWQGRWQYPKAKTGLG